MRVAAVSLSLISLSRLLTETQGNEVVPGLSIVPSNVTCCPTIPLVGPAWQVQLAPTDSDHQLQDFPDNPTCSFYPAPNRPMVVVFQPIGTINGWADHSACQSFQGSYQLTLDELDQEELSPYGVPFVWNQWKTHPFSTCATTTIGTPTPACEEHEIDEIWHRLSSSVASMLFTGHATIELQNRNGDTVVRLQAVAASYECDHMPESSTMRPASGEMSETVSCDPKTMSHLNLGLSQSTLRDFLVMGNVATGYLDGTMRESTGYLFASKHKLAWLLELTLVVTTMTSSSFFVS
jgi:hypothetical protein